MSSSYASLARGTHATTERNKRLEDPMLSRGGTHDVSTAANSATDYPGYDNPSIVLHTLLDSRSYANYLHSTKGCQE